MDVDGDVRFVQKKRHVKDLDVHPTEDAIVVTYEMEAALVGDLGSMFEESKECTKIIRLKSLKESKDLSAVASEVVSKSGGLISPEQMSRVIALLTYLKKRELSNHKIELLRPKTACSRLDTFEAGKNSSTDKSSDSLLPEPLSKSFFGEIKIDLSNETPSLHHLDSYIELLYDEIDAMLKGASLILKLSQDEANLYSLSENSTLMTALVRILREEGKKHIQLATLVVAIFCQFCLFRDFHTTISTYKVGSQCLELLQAEILRADTHNSADGPRDAFSSKKQNNSLRKQNHFIRAAFYLLLLLSEDKKVEQKMVNRGVLPIVVKVLEREGPAELFILTTNLLTRFSIRLENKNTLAELAIVDKLYIIFSSCISSSHVDMKLLHSILVLLFNLSFDFKLNTAMVNVGILPKLLYLWTKDKLKPKTEQVLLQILYQMSRSDKAKGLFSFSFGLGVESLDVVMNKTLKAIQPNSNYKCINQLLALLINLALHPKNAKKISEHKRISSLLERAMNGPSDLTAVLTLKLVRNVALNCVDIRSQLYDFVHPLCNKVFLLDNRSESKSDLHQTYIIECMGILSTLVADEKIPWNQLFNEYNIWNWMSERLKSRTEDDLVLEVILFISTIAYNELVAQTLIGQSEFIPLLLKVVQSRHEDDEFVLQTAFVFAVVLQHDSIRKNVDHRIVNFVTELMDDKNAEIRTVSRTILESLTESNPRLEKQIQLEKFHLNNRHWIEAQTDQFGDSNGEEDEDDSSQPFYMLKADGLNSSLDSVVDSNLSATPSAWDPMFRSMESRTKSASRPLTGYKRR